MKVLTDFKIDGLIKFAPNVYEDSRGQFIETFNENTLREFGFTHHFKQDNQSISKRGSFRGIHLQSEPWGQGKLVRVAKGSVVDYAVDLRLGSPTFGQWEEVFLSGENGHQFWIPAGFGHAFVALEDDTIFCYKCTEVYAPNHQVSIRWDDKDLNLDIPIPIEELEISEKDQNGLYLAEYANMVNKTSAIV